MQVSSPEKASVEWDRVQYFVFWEVGLRIRPVIAQVEREAFVQAVVDGSYSIGSKSCPQVTDTPGNAIL